MQYQSNSTPELDSPTQEATVESAQGQATDSWLENAPDLAQSSIESDVVRDGTPAGDLHWLLELMSDRIEPASLSYYQDTLLEHGLIEVIPDAELELRRWKLCSKPEVQSRISESGDYREQIREAIGRLEQDQDSSWYRFRTLSWFRPKQVEREKEILSELRALDSYQITDIGWARLTERGHEMFSELDGRTNTLSKLTLEEVIERSEIANAQIQEALSRFESIRSQLKERGFYVCDRELNNAAVTLSVINGDQESLFEQLLQLNDTLYNRGFSSYRRLLVGSTLASKGADMNELDSAWSALINKGHSNYLGALPFTAMALIDITGDDPSQKVERYNRFRAELHEHGWDYWSNRTSYIAAKLASREVVPGDLLDDFIALGSALKDQGFIDSRESGHAELVLSYGEGTPAERASRCAKAFSLMVEAGFYDHTENYPIAALVSLIPGDIQENVHLLNQRCKALIDTGYSNDLALRSGIILYENARATNPGLPEVDTVSLGNYLSNWRTRRLSGKITRLPS